MHRMDKLHVKSSRKRTCVRAPDLSQLCHGRSGSTHPRLTSMTESPVAVYLDHHQVAAARRQPGHPAAAAGLRRARDFLHRAPVARLARAAAASAPPDAALLFVTSRAAAARVEVPQGIAGRRDRADDVGDARGARHQGVDRARTAACASWRSAVSESPLVADGAEVFYPTSDAALRQPEHLAAVATLGARLRVHTQAVYSTVAPPNLAPELAALRADPQRGRSASAFWSPSAIENFSAARRLRTTAGPGGAGRRIDDALLARDARRRRGGAPTATTRRRRSSGRCASWSAAPSRRRRR